MTHLLKVLLLVMCGVQCLLLAFLLLLSSDSHELSQKQILRDLLRNQTLQGRHIEALREDIEASEYHHLLLKEVAVHSPQGSVLLLLTTKKPKYYYLLSFKINNLLQNIPSDWIIQVFYESTSEWNDNLNEDVNPGSRRNLFNNSRVYTTEIPKHRLIKGGKEVHYRLQPWLWRYMVAENVLVVDGDFVLCSNSPHQVEDFITYDYIGVSGANHVMDSYRNGVSFRKRSSMLKVLSSSVDELSLKSSSKNSSVLFSWLNDDEFVAQRMQQANDVQVKYNKHRSYHLPTVSTTEEFSSSDYVANGDSFAITGTMRFVQNHIRSEILSSCLESKTLFPALHHPGCFGNDLKREACKLSVCALNLNDTHRDCL